MSLSDELKWHLDKDSCDQSYTSSKAKGFKKYKARKPRHKNQPANKKIVKISCGDKPLDKN